MKRTNTFEVRPRSDSDRKLLRQPLEASASLWNELIYERALGVATYRDTKHD